MAGFYTKIDASDGGSFDAYVAMPKDTDTPAPGLVLFYEVLGMTDWIKETVEFFASKGFCVIAPDIFWRQEPNFIADHRDDAHIEIGRQYKYNLDHDAAMLDTRATLDALSALPECNGKLGAVGFCVGGTLAYMTAARIGVDAMVSYYGTQIHEHLALEQDITCPSLLHMGSRDGHVPEKFAKTIRDTMAKNPNIKVDIYDAGHAFCNSHRAQYYLPDICEVAHTRSIEFFGRLKT